MVQLYLVRHGRAAAAWDADHDPGLDETGRREAEAAAGALASLGPLQLLSSPLRRARETAAAFERIWRCLARIEPRVAEIPSPTADLKERGEWLKGVMAGRWSDQPAPLRAWRERVVASLAECAVDTVVASHFIAINVAVGWATGDDRVICFKPANGSFTRIDVAGDRLSLVRLGREAEGRVL